MHGTRIHPLIGRRLLSPALTDAVFESTIGLPGVPLLRDHRCGGVPVVSGACYLAMAIEAAERALAMPRCVLEDVTFSHALVLPEDEVRVVQLILSFGDGLGEFFKVVSRREETTDDEPCWTVHATGSVARLPGDGEDACVMSPDARERFTGNARHIAGDALYEAMQQHQVQMGPQFRLIRDAWVEDDRVLCHLGTPDGDDGLDRFPLHPVLLDACLHALGGTRPYDPEQTLIPTGVEQLRFFAPPRGDSLWCLVQAGSPESKTLSADARLFEGDGHPIAALEAIDYDLVPREVLLQVLGADASQQSPEPTETFDLRRQGAFAARFEQAPPGERERMVFGLVHDLAGNLLGPESALSIGPDQGFFEAGMDSLRVVQLSTRLQAVLGCPLPSTLAFKYSTLNSLAAYLADEVLQPRDAVDAHGKSIDSGHEGGEDWDAALDELSEDALADRLAARLASLKQGRDA